MIDYQSALYDPLYVTIGVPAVLTLASGGDPIDLTVLDKTAGVDTNTTFEHPHRLKPEVSSVKPAACVRAAELQSFGVTNDQLPGATLEMDGFAWNVTTFKLRPSPRGELDGEILLVLAGKVALDSESESES